MSDAAVVRPPPAPVTSLAAGRPVREAWQNELGGRTFEVGAGARRCFVKWTPASSEINLSAETARMGPRPLNLAQQPARDASARSAGPPACDTRHESNGRHAVAQCHRLCHPSREQTIINHSASGRWLAIFMIWVHEWQISPFMHPDHGGWDAGSAHASRLPHPSRGSSLASACQPADLAPAAVPRARSGSARPPVSHGSPLSFQLQQYNRARDAAVRRACRPLPRYAPPGPGGTSCA
jgi:hypothetical protein